MSEDKELDKIKKAMLDKMMNITPPKPSIWIPGQVIELDDNNFHQALSETNKPVLVDFWAEWCAPCKMMSPIVKQMATEYNDNVHFAKLNTDHSQRTAMQYRVMSIPNFILFKDGKPIGQTVGAVGRAGLVNLISRY